MPYIKQIRRDELCSGETNALPETSGELNYALTILIASYWGHHPNYDGINDIIGALEGAKAEFQRQVVAPYEDKKIAENGGIY